MTVHVDEPDPTISLFPKADTEKEKAEDPVAVNDADPAPDVAKEKLAEPDPVESSIPVAAAEKENDDDPVPVVLNPEQENENEQSPTLADCAYSGGDEIGVSEIAPKPSSTSLLRRQNHKLNRPRLAIDIHLLHLQIAAVLLPQDVESGPEHLDTGLTVSFHRRFPVVFFVDFVGHCLPL